MSDEKENFLYVMLPLFPKGTFQKERGKLKFQLKGFQTKSPDPKSSNPKALGIKDIEDGERREYKPGRGPKYPSGKILPSYLIGHLDTSVERGEAKNIHDAFSKVEEAEITSYNNAKKIYYTALKHDRYRPLIEWNETEESFEEPRNIEDKLEELIAIGGACSRDYLARELGGKRADELFSRYGEKLKANEERFKSRGSDPETPKISETKGDNGSPFHVMDHLGKLDVERDRDEIESYCTLLGLDLETTIDQIKALKSRLERDPG